MSFRIHPTPTFVKELKHLAKRHRSMKQDFQVLVDSLAANPLQSVDLGSGLRKIRMAFTSKGRGKSGGARVITYNVLATEMEGDVYLIDIYDKSDISTVDMAIIKAKIEDLRC